MTEKLNGSDLSLMIWLRDMPDEKLTAQQVARARDLMTWGYVSFHRSSDGNYVSLTEAGRSLLRLACRSCGDRHARAVLPRIMGRQETQARQPEEGCAETPEAGSRRYAEEAPMTAHPPTPSAAELVTLPKRMRDHVNHRGGQYRDADGEIVMKNGAWTMMLEAASYIEQQAKQIAELRQKVYDIECKELNGWLDNIAAESFKSRATVAEARAAMLESEKEALRVALTGARNAIVNADPNVLTCTLWMPDTPSETVVDFIDAALSQKESL